MTYSVPPFDLEANALIRRAVFVLLLNEMLKIENVSHLSKANALNEFDPQSSIGGYLGLYLGVSLLQVNQSTGLSSEIPLLIVFPDLPLLPLLTNKHLSRFAKLISGERSDQGCPHLHLKPLKTCQIEKPFQFAVWKLF